PGQRQAPAWSFLTAGGGYLGGGGSSEGRGQGAGGSRKKKTDWAPASAGQRLTGLDRPPGPVLWGGAAPPSLRPNRGCLGPPPPRHNGVCLGNGRLFAIDRPSDTSPKRQREGRSPLAGASGLSGRARISAWDLATGRKLWSDPKGFGTWLSYSERYDVLVEA